MREIKFRAWNGKDMWLPGEPGLVCLVIDFEGKIYQIKADAGEGSLISLEKDNLFLMQYTGLKDKNGKEIYLGDIIQWDESYVLGGGKKYKAVMEWKGQILFPHINPTSEIIGNIYEHPDLLIENPELLSN